MTLLGLFKKLMDKAVKIKRAVLVLAGISFFGFLDATYLVIEHYARGVVPCYIFEGCDQVINSVYATAFGAPIALFGAVYYLVVLFMAIVYLDTKKQVALNILKHLPWVGMLTTLVLLYLQFFVIHAICLYCMLSAISSIILFITAIYLVKLTSENNL